MPSYFPRITALPRPYAVGTYWCEEEFEEFERRGLLDAPGA
jgi:hypothetical protein